MNEEKPTQYIAYNGLGRSPMVWGIPFMTGLMVMSFCMLGGMLLGVFVSPLGWLFAALGIPVLLFVKSLCRVDDKAMQILAKEMYWFGVKWFSGTARYFGGTLTIAPMSYGRKFKTIKRYFKRIER